MQCTKSMHQKYAKTLKQKVEIYANFPTEKFLSKVMIWAGSVFITWESFLIHLNGENYLLIHFLGNCKWDGNLDWIRSRLYSSENLLMLQILIPRKWIRFWSSQEDFRHKNSFFNKIKWIKKIPWSRVSAWELFGRNFRELSKICLASLIWKWVTELG